MVTLAAAGGKPHHGTPPAVWWGVGAAVALDTLGAIAASRYPYPAPYPPAYPYPYPVPGPVPTRLWCDTPPGYYPQVPWCPQWRVVAVPW